MIRIIDEYAQIWLIHMKYYYELALMPAQKSHVLLISHPFIPIRAFSATHAVHLSLHFPHSYSLAPQRISLTSQLLKFHLCPVSRHPVLVALAWPLSLRECHLRWSCLLRREHRPSGSKWLHLHCPACPHYRCLTNRYPLPLYLHLACLLVFHS